MMKPQPRIQPPLQAFEVELRGPQGTEVRYIAATDLLRASQEAVGAMAIDLPEAEVVAVRHLGPALTP